MAASYETRIKDVAIRGLLALLIFVVAVIVYYANKR